MNLSSDNSDMPLNTFFGNNTGPRLSRREFLIICSAIAAVISMPSMNHAETLLTVKNEKSAASPDSADLKAAYPTTLTVLKSAYLGEIKAHMHYIEYAKRAKKENYKNIAYLLTALAASEYIHAREFSLTLSAFGITVEEFEKPDRAVSSTKANLRTAAKNELRKIEVVYPDFVKKLRKENHADSQKNCLYAWKSHEQHSAHLKKILKWSGFFFAFLAKKFEDNPVQYFVCRICGSTVVELPQINCPICTRPASEYRLIERDQTDFT